MDNTNITALQIKRDSINLEISSTESKKQKLDDVIARVATAKRNIGRLKEEARDKYKNYGKDAIDYIGDNWTAKRKRQFIDECYSYTYTTIERYIKEIDNIQDALVTKEHYFNVERNSLSGKLFDLRNALSWVLSNLEKIFN